MLLKKINAIKSRRWVWLCEHQCVIHIVYLYSIWFICIIKDVMIVRLVCFRFQSILHIYAIEYNDKLFQINRFIQSMVWVFFCCFYLVFVHIRYAKQDIYLAAIAVALDFLNSIDFLHKMWWYVVLCCIVLFMLWKIAILQNE